MTRPVWGWRAVVVLAAALNMVAASAVAQVAGETDRPITSHMLSTVDAIPPVDSPDYVIPFMVLTDIETDFGLAPPSPDDVLRDASIDVIDPETGHRQARR